MSRRLCWDIKHTKDRLNMWHGFWLLVFCIVKVPGIVEALPTFQDLIPNGKLVPNPCDDTATWGGVGHQNSQGGGTRNPFGADFELNGKKWSVKLCQLDSDGDGLTNGQELGDPNCTWTKGNSPSFTNNLSHPGICEPITADRCKAKNNWLKCGKRKACGAFKEQGTKNVTLRFPSTRIPVQVTTYYCQIFELPTEGDFHLVGTRPLIDNKDLTHHILLFGCDERDGQVSATPSARECGMLAHPQCLSIIGTWTVGSHGDCLHTDMGFRIGRMGFRKAALQIHWNNPGKKERQTDMSGLVLYYTETLRENDAGIFVVGQDYIEIPPRQQEVAITSHCSGECTEAMFPVPVYITRAVNHMHYLGIEQRITLHRNGTKIVDLTFDKPYNYDSPVFHKYNPPIEILPGDEIKTKCVYSSMNRNETVYFGDGTSDEMCLGFLTYYPMQNIPVPYCTTWKSVEKCKRYLPKFKGIVDNCKWREFLRPTNVYTKRILTTVHLACSNSSRSNTCSDSCINVVEDARTKDCLRGDLGDFLLRKMSNNYHDIVWYLHMCRNTSGPYISSTNSFVPHYYSLILVIINLWIIS